jgi:hypothetical protein
MLPSGLPEEIDNNETLARFLTSSSLFNSIGAKPAAFLPNPKYKNTSVFRQISSSSALRQKWTEVGGNRSLHGVALLNAHQVRSAQLDVESEEPPPAHANIINWPWIENDPELQKAKQRELANALAQQSELMNLEISLKPDSES